MDELRHCPLKFIYDLPRWDVIKQGEVGMAKLVSLFRKPSPNKARLQISRSGHRRKSSLQVKSKVSSIAPKCRRNTVSLGLRVGKLCI